ncbi:hypothetical protein GRF29_106g337947 [Pseudopithomyces chartarum]|uniref:Uncharacterized protein n=1 Tax=Pseudopithomyces chartarum TaxID=1892770 RepID=A0AAN6LUW9_9PLEO|nr:hypothetical protein GRF29_106g337947 [Pseudopithomyces chartarum]
MLVLPLISLLTTPVFAQDPLGGFCAHLKDAKGDSPKHGLWLPCENPCSVSDLTGYHYIDIDSSTSCTFYDDPTCKLDPSHTGEVIKGPQQDWEFNASPGSGRVRKAYTCTKVANQDQDAVPAGHEHKITVASQQSGTFAYGVSVGHLKEYTGSSGGNYLTLVGDSTCNNITNVRYYHYIGLYFNSKCALYSDAFCNNKIGNDFIGPLSEVRFETGDPPKAYNCEPSNETNHTSQYTMHFLAAILSGLTLASVAAAFPSALAKVGHLTYGDVELDVNNGCQAVPQNKPNAVLPNPSYFTRLEVNSGYTCELYQSSGCKDSSFMATKGPASSAEYVSGRLFAVKCRKG